MNLWFPREWCDSIRSERLQALAAFGFTERQARFLVTVLIHSGVFIERQYLAFARIAHGQNTRDFMAKLVSCGYATPILPGAQKGHTRSDRSENYLAVGMRRFSSSPRQWSRERCTGFATLRFV